MILDRRKSVPTRVQIRRPESKKWENMFEAPMHGITEVPRHTGNRKGQD